MAKTMPQPATRPDPDALLTLARGERSGRLKVFLGAAPGVGKTFAMLEGARRLKADGLDVVIGIVETHGRAETIEKLQGLEVLPRRMFDHRGRTLAEFDVDVALTRRPKLLILDELAHTNAPDSRHPKRWQDARELLDAGIDVWTALNIQHLESLADVVSRITGVAVRETVPDTVLRDATDIVVVDITPDELIARLNEGKIYLPETARRAIENFFTPANLTALRELALRRTADRVDDQMVDLLRQQAIEGPWETAERLLACIGADDISEQLVRRTSRLATALNASWIAVHLERADAPLDAARAAKTAAILRLAEQLGAEVTQLNDRDFSAGIIRLARKENVTQIVIGRAEMPWPRALLRRSLADALMRISEGIEVHVVPGPSKRPRPPAALRLRGLPAECFAACVAVGAAVGIGQALSVLLKLPNLSMIFLVSVLACAVLLGTRAAVVASILSFLAYNFFFIEPIYTLTIAEPHELFALLIFLAVATLTGSLTGRIRDQSAGVIRRAEITQSLYDFSRKISGAATSDDVVWAATSHMHKMLGGEVALLLPDEDGLKLAAIWPPDSKLDQAESTAARWALQKAEPAGWATGTLPNVRFQFRPLTTSGGVVGVCGFSPRAAAATLSADDESRVAAVLDQTAIALDRAMLAGDAIKTSALEANEKVRDALIASLSHDLKTPLASITGAVTSLRELGDLIDVSARQDLLVSIEEETQRLSQFLNNLLDMSRIESGAVKVRRDYVDVTDVIRAAVERCRKAFPDQTFHISIAPDLPFTRGDAHLLAQVLFNLLDNAHKYGGGTDIAIHARRENEQLVISVTDEGKGVKPSDLERIFEKFYRGGRNDGRPAGTGLGLSICRGLIDAMGGSIVAQSPAIRRKGTRMIIRLPATLPPVAREIP